MAFEALPRKLWPRGEALTPIAQLSMTPTELSEAFGVPFERVVDDLGPLDVAVVRIPSGDVIVLERHKFSPEAGTAISVEASLAGPAVVQSFVGAMGLAIETLTWVSPSLIGRIDESMPSNPPSELANLEERVPARSGIPTRDTPVDQGRVIGRDIDLLRRQFDPMQALGVEDSEPYVDWQRWLEPDTPDVKSRLVRAFSRTRPAGHPVIRLLTGHRGVGKTTELNRLRARLENGEGGRRVFVSTLYAQRWLDIEDVQPEDLVLQIVRQLVSDLDWVALDFGAQRFRSFWDKIMSVRLDQVGLDVDPLTFSFSLKDFPSERDEFRKLLRGQLPTLYDLVIQELIPQAREHLRETYGFDDILVIVEDLDKIPQKVITDRGLTNHESLFLDHAGTLLAITCNLVLTIPIELAYSPAQDRLQTGYGSILTVPLIPVHTRTGQPVEAGQAALVDVIARRAAIAGLQPMDVFEDEDLLRRVVMLSGGHMRGIIRLLAEMLWWTDELPLTGSLVDQYVSRASADMALALFEADWALLRTVRTHPGPVDDPRFFKLLRNHYVFAYEDDNDYWYGLNPLLDEFEGGAAGVGRDR